MQGKKTNIKDDIDIIMFLKIVKFKCKQVLPYENIGKYVCNNESQHVFKEFIKKIQPTCARVAWMTSEAQN